MPSTELFEIDESISAGPAPIIIDRSTAERYATCPLQGYMVEQGLVSSGGTAADIGSEIHRIISRAVRDRFDHSTRINDLRDLMREAAANSRPDIQPDVMEKMWSVGRIADLICRHADTGAERNPDDLLRFDGGEGDRSGQLSADIISAAGSRGAVRLTGEVDLLLPTASPERVDLYDWKSGWKHYTAGDVARSFQLGAWYPWLVFRNYPGVHRVGVRVFMVGAGEMTDVVIVDRKDFYTLEKRILSAVEIALQSRECKTTDIETWPAPEKCSICPALGLCSRAFTPISKSASNAKSLIANLVVAEAYADSCRELLKGMVKANGGDLVFDDVAFGNCEPKESASRAKPCKLYRPAPCGK